MYISDLDIFGFKSFAHKSHFRFAKGITCVVGPNGCGKTNVVDAIRWVMGEQRSLLLRSDKMTDVIFGGSKYKKPLNYAEVSLTIHNDRGILPVAYTDLTLSRRLFRDNTSEYLLNSTPVRLKDIQDLFTDTGMSSDVYSVIELKMVEDILNENRDSRKRLFEEASGIGKYRSQRKSSIRKLDATRDDLKRLEDIIYEIDKKVSALHRQLKRYEKYQEYLDELRDTEILHARLQYQNLSDEIDPLEERLTHNQNRQDENTQQLSIEEAMLENYQFEQTEMEQDLENRNRDLEVLRNRINEARTARMVLEEKILNARRTLERLERDREDALKRRAANESIRDEIAGSLDGNDPLIESLKKDLEAAENELKAAEEKHQDISRRGEELEKNLLEHRARIQELQQAGIRHEDSLKQLTEVSGNLQTQIADSERRSGETRKRAEELKRHLGQLEKEKGLMDQARTEKESERELLNEKIREGRETISRLQARMEQDRKELRFYRGILESMEGFNPGVKYVLRELKHPGILGTVADLIEVEPSYMHAVEIGLGNAARFLVSDTRNSALDVIDTLKNEKKGRVTIVPLDIAAEKIRRRPGLDYEKSPNFIAYVTDIVTADARASLLVDFFLNDLVLVKSLRDIPDHLLTRGHFRFVTPDGDYYEQKGLIKGGKNRDSGRQILGRREKIRDLEEEIRELEGGEEKLREQIRRASDDLAGLNAALSEIISNRDSLDRQFHEADKSLGTFEYELKRSLGDREEAEKRLASYSARMEDTRKAMQELEKEHAAAEKRAEESRKVYRDFQQENEQFLEEKNILAGRVQNIRIDLITREREKETVQFRYNNAVEVIRDLSLRLMDIEREKEELNGFIEKGEAEKKTGMESLSADESLLEEKLTAKNALQQTLQEKRRQITDTNRHIQEQRKARENVFQTLKDIEIRLGDIRQQQKQIRDRVYERYHYDISVREYVESDMEMAEIEESIDKLRRKIELIGPINMAVKVEYDEESARLKFLQEQQADLLEAERSILETLEKLDHEARTQFTDIFRRVRENFNKTFTLFFPNGEGDIKLVGHSDPLEANIEIYARPKTKDLKTLKALSGGEKALTAISLLFSIYLVKPSPYCILDEVDAPLDDLNIRRFTAALRHFTDNTQFIIVTHNKLTMEAADYLYGVTMEEEGVSKIVSVKFNEAEVETEAPASPQPEPEPGE